MTTEILTATFALIGAVSLAAALLSGVVERVGFPQVAVFLALGAVLGPAGFGVLDIGLDSSALRIVATLSLVLVLFTDAVGLDMTEVRRHGVLAGLILGPGTLLSAVLIALLGWLLLGLSLPAAAVLGAALASTDPVLLRGLLRRQDIPGATRQALRLESGLNDVVLLPIVLVAMEFLGHTTALTGAEWARLALDLFVLGPGAGVLVGLIAVATLDLVRRRIGVRRDYESLYSLGVAFAAYAAAEAVHGSGFLAAFAAGLTITWLDVELCDCFLEYGETTAEMALLFTFVLFGGSLIWTGLTILGPTVLLFAVAALAVRPLVLLAALARQRLDRRARRLIVWFGPRGLSSLLLVLLPVFAGQSGSPYLFSLTSLVVLLSIVVHGASSMLVERRAAEGRRTEDGGRRTADGGQGTEDGGRRTEDGGRRTEDGGQAAVDGRQGGDKGLDGAEPLPTPYALPLTHQPIALSPASDRITIEELRALWEAGEEVVVLDARTERAFNNSPLQPRGVTRFLPANVGAQARQLGLPHDAWLVAFCA